jgi:hypothetical protein
MTLLKCTVQQLKNQILCVQLRQAMLPVLAPSPVYNPADEHRRLLIKNNSHSSEPRQPHCADSSYSRIEGLNLETFVTALRQVLKVTAISPANKEGNATNVCYTISSFRKISCYISSSLYFKTSLTSRRVQFKQANKIIKKEYLQNIWFHTMYVCCYLYRSHSRLKTSFGHCNH